MPTDCGAILDVARELAKRDGEAFHRSAVSRAYYAAMHRVVSALPPEFALNEAERRSGSSHEAVIQALTAWGKSVTPGRQNARYASYKLPKLKAARKHADYVLNMDVTQEMANEAIDWAEEVFGYVRPEGDSLDTAVS